MGTRADFYIQHNNDDLEWVGSIAYDGGWWADNRNHVDAKLIRSRSLKTFRIRLTAELVSRSDATFPGMGWPWPWKSSYITDYVYVFNTKTQRVKVYREDKNAREWPDMTKPKDGFTTGERSGALFFR